MQYMVCRTDAVERSIKTSELFPVIVDLPDDARLEDVVLQTLQRRWPGYVGKHDYYVVPMQDAAIVSFVPKADYDVIVRRAVDY